MSKFKSFKSKIREKLTIMVVPHSQKEIKNIHLPKWAIILGILFLIGTISFSVVTITKYAYLTIKQKEYASENEKMIKELENLIYNSDNLINVQKTFSLSLNKLLETAGLSREIFFKETGLGGPLVNANHPGIDKKDLEMNSKEILEIGEVKEVEHLAKMEKEIDVINKKIVKLSKKLRHFEKVTRFIPSIWPILGDGQIMDSSNASQLIISTLPYTPVIATANGKISRIVMNNNKVTISIAHRFQFNSIYSNLYTIEDSVSEGKVVKKGQIIGYVAKNSGKSLFEYKILIGNKSGYYPVNPLNFTYLGR